MKAHELRIGNWVEINNPEYRPNDTGKIARVVQISELKGDVYLEIIDQYEGYFGQFLKYIKPIPLTEQWLLEFGFEKSNHYKISTGKGVILVNNFEFYVYSGLGIAEEYGFEVSIKYVHQLQNLYYALTGEELVCKPTKD